VIQYGNEGIQKQKVQPLGTWRGCFGAVLLAAAAVCSRSGWTRAGGGKRGGYRVVVGYKRPNAERIIFLYAFAKSDKTNISAREEAALSLVAESFVSTADKQVQELLAAGSIWEVQCHERDFGYCP
jgi:hypothetical protein